MLEIDCPESCGYLKAGRERDSTDYRKRLLGMDGPAQKRNNRVLTDHQDVVARLEYTLSRERLLANDLTDSDVAQSVDILLDTYRTEDKGVLYEKTSDDLQVEYLRRELRKIIESCRNPEGKEGRGIVDPKETRLQLSAAIECLEYIRSMVTSYLEERHGVAGYLDTLARVIGRGDRSGSIIIP